MVIKRNPVFQVSDFNPAVWVISKAVTVGCPWHSHLGVSHPGSLLFLRFQCLTQRSCEDLGRITEEMNMTVFEVDLSHLFSFLLAAYGVLGVLVSTAGFSVHLNI